ncbi:MAG: hypothetical protein II776_03080 [Clostridia bacterium]|nr:hypothetical protein [Clostridia bacterium]
MLYPIIDVGSNTVKLAVLDEDKLFTSAPVFFKAVPLRLRARLDGNRLREDALNDLVDLVREFCAISARLTPAAPLAFATASLRGLDDREAILARVEKETGVRIEVISGETEAYYAFLGVLGHRGSLSGVAVDLGGGSTEILSFRHRSVLKGVSLPMGCLTLFEKYFASGQNRMVECRGEIREKLADAPRLEGNTILFSGGSAKALLRYKNLLENKNNSHITRRQMEKVLWHFDHGRPEEKARAEEILQDRYKLVPPAVAVFTEILAHYKKEQVTVCRSGVREGRLQAYLMEK